MERKNKWMALFLAMVLAAGAMSACAGEETAETAETQVQTEAETEDPNLRINAKDNLPADLNYGGERIGWVCHTATTYQISVGGMDELTGDVVMDAVYNRTAAVEERLNIDLDTTYEDLSWQDYGTKIENTVMAGDSIWDIIYTKGNSSIQMGRDHLYLPLQDMQYLELDQPWWWTEAIDEMSLDGNVKRYLLGDLIMDNLHSGIRVVYFNKDIMTDIGEDVDGFYQQVLDGDWTMDLLTSLTEKAYVDTDGNGEMNLGDQFGCYIGEKYMVYGMSAAHDVKRQSRDEKNYAYMDFDVERAQTSLDAILKFAYDTQGSWFVGNNDQNRIDNNCFASGKALFAYNRLDFSFTDNARNMESPYGILPSPKLDDSQEWYRSLVTNAGTFATVPITCNKEYIGAVLEAIAAESYRSVVEPYFEVALKTKYSSDSYTAQCLDIIRDTAYKSILTEYDANNSGYMEFNLIMENSNALASRIRSITSASETNMKKIYQSFERSLEP